MIQLNRNKLGMKILEQRYPDNFDIGFNGDVIKIYSFSDVENEFDKVPLCTMQIDLTQPEEILWNNISKKYRKHLSAEERKHITISKCDRYDEFYNKLYLPLCRKNKMKPYPIDYMRQGDLWLAEQDGKILSGSIVFSDAIFATQSFTASERINYNGNRFLIWTATKYYKSEGLKYFNFGGGESDYKRRFGSEKILVWRYTKYISARARLLNYLRGILISRQ